MACLGTQNRVAQCLGRTCRVSQTHVCHLRNMLASKTRECRVFHCLFEKLEIEREALGGRVVDILDEVLDEKSLKYLLVEPSDMEMILNVVKSCGERWSG